MELSFNRLERKYSVQEIEIQEENMAMMVELFVRDNLGDEAQECFYAELENKEVTEVDIKNALYKAVLSNQVVVAIKQVTEFYEGGGSKNDFVESVANKALEALRDEDRRMNE